jgi:hypothetical protein
MAVAMMSVQKAPMSLMEPHKQFRLTRISMIKRFWGVLRFREPLIEKKRLH